jgi:hypothetical protein
MYSRNIDDSSTSSSTSNTLLIPHLLSGKPAAMIRAGGPPRNFAAGLLPAIYMPLHDANRA